MKKCRLTAAALALAIVASSLPAIAETPEEKGRAIAEEVDRRDLGWRDSRTAMTMILSNKQGDRSERSLRLTSLETTDPALGDKSLTIFDSPRDVEGTAFLSHTNILEQDDQWLFLPALKRVKRISSANKSGPFVGSEFAYEDLLSQEVDKYDYKYLEDQPCADGLNCFVVERYPRYENSGYTRTVVWIDQDEYRPIKVEYYDRRDALLKTLTLSSYEQYLGQYWRSHRQEMINHQTGKATVLEFEPYEFQIGLDDGDFVSSKLKRVR